jgi:hypothetical protein
MHDEPDIYINNDDEPSVSHTPEPAAHEAVHHIVETSRKEYMKFFGILLFLVLAGLVMSGLTGFNWEEWMRWFMGGFFIVFGGFKLIGYEMFVLSFKSYDLIAKKHKVYAYVYPFIEVFLGMLYALNILPVPRDLVTIALMTVGAFGVTKAIAHKNAVQCACLGNVIKLPLTTVSLIENLTMAAMAFIMLLTAFFL